MMPISVSFLRNKRAARNAAGFTLVEILVVLVIMGLLAGVALPKLVALYGSVERAGQRSSILGEIEGLGYRAYISGKPLVLDSIGGGANAEIAPDPLHLPAGWRIMVSKPLRYTYQGICSGGKLTLAAPDGSRETFNLNPPLCRIEAEGKGA